MVIGLQAFGLAYALLGLPGFGRNVMTPIFHVGNTVSWFTKYCIKRVMYPFSAFVSQNFQCSRLVRHSQELYH